MPNGSTASSGDVAPAESPVQVLGLSYSAGDFLTFSATGIEGFGPGDPTSGPDGIASILTPHAAGAQNGVSDITAPANALVGVFLTSTQPSLSVAPGALDFSTAASRDYSTLSPPLQQVFFIGDGLTSTSAVQHINIPNGATRFFLGPMDGFDWNNNVGSYSVTVNEFTPNAAVPEPAPLCLLAAGLLTFLSPLAKRRRRTCR
jgi:hypothetical protein